MSSNIAIIDYGMGNLHSVEKALQKAGATTTILSTPEKIFNFNKIVVPGVGAFGDAVQNLKDRGLFAPIVEHLNSNKPYLGICVGMQLMVNVSYEKGEHAGFSYIEGKVEKFNNNNKIPQIGWNQTNITNESPLFKGITNNSYFYFVHSYYVTTKKQYNTIATTEYGITYSSAIQKENAFGVQFHPEKSQSWGLKVLNNFVNF